MTPEEISRQKDGRMKFHELQAIWWMHAASNGHAATRVIRHGGSDGALFTPEEHRDDAMKTAQRHMHILLQFADGSSDPYLT
jgi:hypothetical protein